LFACADEAAQAAREAEGMEGERPRKAKSKKARASLKRRNPEAVAPTGKGIKPLKRGR
jgi:hypothetical protein